MTAEIIHGDCLDVLRGMPDASIDAVITDPPYGTEALGGGYGRLHSTIANDDDLSALRSALPHMLRVLRPDGWVLVFCAAKMRHDANMALADAGLPPFGEVVWDKGAPGLGYHIRYAHETVVVCRIGNPPKPDHALLSVLRDTRRRKIGHPHEKPVGIMARLVAWACPPDGVVLDPFAGSGSTGVAALLEGRSFIGIEREAAYVEIARKRIAEAQAQTALPLEAAS